LIRKPFHRAGGIAEVVEGVFSKHEALSSNPSTEKKKKKKKKRKLFRTRLDGTCL
jgi:hypothetical protein